MDACVDHVAALENRRVTTYTGNYSSYLKQREDNLEQMRAKRAAQERDIAHMQVFVDKFRYKPTKAAQGPGAHPQDRADQKGACHPARGSQAHRL